MNIYISPRKFAAATAAREGLTHAVSILNPHQRLLDDLNFSLPPNRHLVIRFDDHENPNTSDGPRLEHAKQLVTFAYKCLLYETTPRVLIHCEAGISRSTAAALAFKAISSPELSSKALADWLLMVQPDACPNRLLVSHFESILNTGGIITEASELANTIFIGSINERYGIE